jgi:hypothetical protein
MPTKTSVKSLKTLTPRQKKTVEKSVNLTVKKYRKALQRLAST